jgi:hypothetical protein
MAATRAVPAGHADAACAVAVDAGRRLLLSGGEDGLLALVDLSTLRRVGAVRAPPGDAVAALCLGARSDVFAAAGAAVLRLDLRAGLSGAALLEDLHAGGEEVNSVAADAAGVRLACADDAGEITVLEVSAGAAAATADSAAAAPRARALRALRRGHSSIASAVAFRPHRAGELLSAGLDCAVVRWDVARARVVQSWEMAPGGGAAGINPPMVHALAVPATDDRSLARLAAAARGDGCVVVLDCDARTPAAPPARPAKAGKAAGSAKGAAAAAGGGGPVAGVLALLPPESGGHAAAANSVCFLEATGWRRLLSAGSDRRLVAWDWAGAAAAAAAGGGGEAGGEAGAAAFADAGGAGSAIAGELRHSAKINWVCAAAGAPGGYDAFIADVAGGVTAVRL